MLLSKNQTRPPHCVFTYALRANWTSQNSKILRQVHNEFAFLCAP